MKVSLTATGFYDLFFACICAGFDLTVATVDMAEPLAQSRHIPHDRISRAVPVRGSRRLKDRRHDCRFLHQRPMHRVMAKNVE